MKAIQILQRYWHERNKKNKNDVVEYVLWGVGSVLGFGFVWSLLFRVFNKSPVIPLPWESFSLAFSYTQNTVKTNTLLFLSFCAPAFLTGLMISGVYQQKRLKDIHGDAHWASMREIQKMGLLDCRSGLIIGKKQGYLLRAPLISHALVFAPSRSGKGVSQVMPNALTFNDSLLVIDIKDEIFEASSGFRQKHGQTVYSFAPLRDNRKTHRWNPLDMIDPNAASLIGDIDLIVETLIRYTDDVEKDVWNPEARALLKGLLL